MLEMMPEFITSHRAPYKASFRSPGVHMSPVVRPPIGVKNIDPVVPSHIYERKLVKKWKKSKSA